MFRLVCRRGSQFLRCLAVADHFLGYFDEEIQHILKGHITITHTLFRPYRSRFYSLISPEEPKFDFRNKIMASALYNTASKRDSSDRQADLVSRLKNCTAIAQHILEDVSHQKEQELLKMFCTAASSSQCCWSYMLAPRTGSGLWVEKVDRDGYPLEHGDMLLEMSLLIASGFALEDTKKWLFKLKKEEYLSGYRDDDDLESLCMEGAFG